jgi:hypothetical protein
MADDEIAVDGYVLKPETRGRSLDPRALKPNKWIVKMRMLDNGRTFQVPVINVAMQSGRSLLPQGLRPD